MPKARPKHLNLLQIRLPVPALVSILHRVSGAILFLAIPFLLWLLELSLESQGMFAAFKAVMSHWIVKLVLLGLLWGYLHHLLAGVRHLALDMNVGTELAAARTSSYAVLALGAAITLAVAVLLW